MIKELNIEPYKNSLEKISTFTKHSKIIEGPVAILCDFNLMKADQ